MGCCSHCFTDRFLQPFIEASPTNIGRCRYCESEQVNLVEPELLGEYFEPLIGIYVESGDASARPLHQCIQEDWRVFSHNAYEDLFAAITANLDFERDANYRISRPADHGLIEQWNSLANELKYRNRYFPNLGLDREFFAYLISNLQVQLDNNSLVYRARIKGENDPFRPAELRMPPAGRATQGRANPSGIPYFYISSDSQTAIAEVRPQCGDVVTIAEFRSERMLNLIDLTSPVLTMTPFGHDQDLETILLSGLPLLQHLGNELSRPVNSEKSNLDYLPTQYLCELIKTMEFDGVIYNSSLTRGKNYATFQDDYFGYVACNDQVVTQIDVTSVPAAP